MSAEVRVALVGLGHIGRVHVSAMAESSMLTLVAGCDRDPAQRACLPDGVRFHPDHSELFAAGGFEVAVIATPNATHADIGMAAIGAGYHIIMEKPAASSLSELVALEEVAHIRDRSIYYAFHAAMAREVEWASGHLSGDGRRYGPLTGFHCRFFDDYARLGSVTEHARGLGDPWSDSGVNALSVIDRFIPADRLEVAHRSVDPLAASVEFRFDGGTGTIETAWDRGRDHKSTELRFARTGFALLLDHTGQAAIEIAPDGTRRSLVAFDGDRLKNHYLGVFADFTASWKSGTMNGKRSYRIHERLFVGSEH